MSTQHTPGPWIAKPTAGDHDFIIYSEVDPARDVALVRDFHQANADLIAAAPELLDCLEDVEANLTGRDNFPERVADSLRRIKAAIAKARGGRQPEGQA